MTNLQEVINQLADKRESRLNNEKTAREKMFVLAHERLAVLVLSMLSLASNPKRDFGDRASETWFCGNVVESVTMLTARFEGVISDVI